MAKRIVPKPDWLKADQVDDVLSVSSCISEDFTDWINYWRHNGYWLFDSPEVIIAIAEENGIDLTTARWFYYEAHENECDEDGESWMEIVPEERFAVEIAVPSRHRLAGFDVVTYSLGNSAECSPLSCNNIAEHVRVNSHCLLDSFEDAKVSISEKAYLDAEPGPLRIIAVYETPPPQRK